MIELLLNGIVRPKKNSRRTFRSASTGKQINLPSEAYKAWHDDAAYSICSQISNDIDMPVLNIKLISIYFILPETRKRDLTNMAESIMDLLVDCNIIKDDNFLEVPKIELAGKYIKGVAETFITIV